MNSLSQALQKKAGTIKKAVIGAASDVLSAPARISNGLKAQRSNSDADSLRLARKYDNAPNTPGSDAFKARSMADAVRAKYSKPAAGMKSARKVVSPVADGMKIGNKTVPYRNDAEKFGTYPKP